MKRLTITLAAVAALGAMTMAGTGCSESDNMYGTYGSSSDSSAGDSGGGSMARFTISGDWLYTVDNADLTAVSLHDPAHPIEGERRTIGFDVETIFPMDTLLFIGSQSGMHIYNIKNREFPEFISQTAHFRSCDPVVAADTLAFVTLNSALGRWCGQSTDKLIVYDISNIYAPEAICEVQLTGPRGLAVDYDKKMLFVCDGPSGIKALDITNPRGVKLLYSALSLPGVGRIDSYDCMVRDGRLIVVGSSGIYQMGYDHERFTFISKIDIRKRQ